MITLAQHNFSIEVSTSEIVMCDEMIRTNRRNKIIFDQFKFVLSIFSYDKRSGCMFVTVALEDSYYLATGTTKPLAIIKIWFNCKRCWTIFPISYPPLKWAFALFSFQMKFIEPFKLYRSFIQIQLYSRPRTTVVYGNIKSRHHRGSTAHFLPCPSGSPSFQHLDSSIACANFEIRICPALLRFSYRSPLFYSPFEYSFNYPSIVHAFNEASPLQLPKFD